MSGYAPIGFYKNNSPRVRIDESYCTGCMHCVGACPAGGALKAGKTNGGLRAYVADAAKCVGCGRCVNGCPTHAIGIYFV